MFDRDDLPTRPYPALCPEPTKVSIRLPEYLTNAGPGAPLEDLTIEDTLPPTRVLSAALPVSAKEAYDLFCDSERIHEWMGVVRSSRVLSRKACGRPDSTAFLARLERSSMGYTMRYDYDDASLTVRWCNGQNSSTRISGTAQFTDTGSGSCMMHYELDMESDTSLPAWGDPMYNGHPAASVISDFREFVTRNRP